MTARLHSIGRHTPAQRLRSAAWLWGAILAGVLIGGLLWQASARTHQQIDVGAPLDELGAIDFHQPERSGPPTNLSYRWSQPQARLRFSGMPPGAPAELRLHLFGLPQPDGPQHVMLVLAGQPLGEVIVATQPRLYRFLITTPAVAPLELTLTSPPLRAAGDPRALGVAVDYAAIEIQRNLQPADLWFELVSLPLLPLGLLLLAGAARLLGLPLPAQANAPLLALVGLALAGRALPDARLMLAWYLVIGAAVAFAALAGAALLHSCPRVGPIDDRRALRWMVAAFVLMLALTFSPQVKSDGIEYYAYLRSLAVDGDLNFRNEYQATPFPLISPKFQPTITGNYENLAAVGPAIVWAPLYGIGHLLTLAGQALGLPWLADGYAPPYVVLSMFTSALGALGIMLAGYRIVRRWVEPPIATLAAIALIPGSNLLYYCLREGSFAHALSGLAATLFVLAWLRLEERPSIARWGLVGLAAGATTLMYWISALVLLLPVFTFGRLLLAVLRGPAEQRKARLRTQVAGGAVAAALLILAFSPQLIAWKVIYGSFLAIPHGNDYIRPREFQGLKLLFSHLYGLLPWTPAYFAGLCGLALLWGRNRYLTLALGAALLAYFGYNASLARWFAGGSFGLRRMTVLTPWLLIGLALAFDALHRWRMIAPAAPAVLMGAWTMLLLVRYDLFVFPHSPEQIAAMPALTFYINRDTLPFWGLPGWLRNGFFAKQLATLAAPADATLFIAMVLVMAVAVYAALWCYHRLAPD